MIVSTIQLWKIWEKLDGAKRVNVMSPGCGYCEYDESDGGLFRHCEKCMRTACWMWTGARNTRGHPVIRSWSGLRLVRRLVVGWAQKRHLPPSRKVIHQPTGCCNPCHLELASGSDVATERWAKTRKAGDDAK